MWHPIHLVAAPVGLLLGLFCVLTAILLYPDEDGKIQSAFETFWVRVDDYQKLALSRHAAFITQVASLEGRFLDKVFGPQLISDKAFGVSFCCSVGTVSFATWLFINTNRESFNALTARAFDILLVGLLLGSLAVGAASIFIRRRRFVRRTIVIVGPIVMASWIVMVSPEPSYIVKDIGEVILVAALGGFACDVIFVAMTRWLLRWAAETQSFLQVLAIVMLNVLLALFLTSPLFLALADFIDGHGIEPYFGSVGIGNAFDVIMALLFVLLAALLLIHRVFWPILVRTLFRVQDIGTKGRRGILMTIGLALLAWSGAKLPQLVKELVKALGKG